MSSRLLLPLAVLLFTAAPAWADTVAADYVFVPQEGCPVQDQVWVVLNNPAGGYSIRPGCIPTGQNALPSALSDLNW